MKLEWMLTSIWGPGLGPKGLLGPRGLWAHMAAMVRENVNEWVNEWVNERMERERERDELAFLRL